MIEDDDMRLIFLDTDAFGEDALITPDNAPAYTIQVVFSAKPTNTQNYDNRPPFHAGARASGSNPQFRCRSADMPKNLAGKATVTLRERDYTVFDVEHDGTGMAIVEIRLAAA